MLQPKKRARFRLRTRRALHFYWFWYRIFLGDRNLQMYVDDPERIARLVGANAYLPSFPEQVTAMKAAVKDASADKGITPSESQSQQVV